ncbi:S1C family serine protease [Pantanalinema rosaneae CENA516]|uniref:S1C family serine protease n=1 Tax=Pantanalinema rosaneae TaxID=1620701 RepID=UPI003D6EB192
MRQSSLPLVVLTLVVISSTVAVVRGIESIATSNQPVLSSPPSARLPIATSLSPEHDTPLDLNLEPLPGSLQPPTSSTPEAPAARPTPSPSASVPPPSEVASQPLELSDARIYQLVNPAVVTIYVGREVGSGSIVSADGLVITNTHVVRRAVRQNQAVTVRTVTGREYAGQVVATDRANDLALIRVAASALPEVRLANSEVLQIGQTVHAIGSPFGRAGVMTTGRLLHITQKGDLQSNVQLKPGNSGGPLLNTQGEMIGVNKGIRPPGDGFAEMTSLATNVAVAKSFIEQNRDRTTPIVEPRFLPGTNFPPAFGEGFDRRDR